MYLHLKSGMEAELLTTSGALDSAAHSPLVLKDASRSLTLIAFKIVLTCATCAGSFGQCNALGCGSV
jgi:hypothetical protein